MSKPDTTDTPPFPSDSKLLRDALLADASRLRHRAEYAAQKRRLPNGHELPPWWIGRVLDMAARLEALAQEATNDEQT